MRNNLGDGVWWKSSRSPLGDNCVEVARLGDTVGIRDSKNRVAGILVVSTAAWRRFVEGVRAGDFDS